MALTAPQHSRIAATYELCQKGKLVSNGCGNKSHGADSGARPALTPYQALLG
jgi:hypothetical protein